MKPLFLLVFYFFLHVSAELKLDLSQNKTGTRSLIDELDYLAKNEASNFDGSGNKRKLTGEFDMEPPDTYSRSVNLFYGRMLFLMEKNMQQDIDTIAKYTNQDTSLFLCEYSKRSTFAELRRFIRLLHMYFKSVKQESLSMQPSDDQKTVFFQLKYKALTVEKTEVIMEWHGESHWDENLRYFLYKKLDLKGDCTRVPDEIPEHPVQDMQSYMNRLESNLTNVVFNGPKTQRAHYQTFVHSFLLERTNVQFCEQNGETMSGRNYLWDYLQNRYTGVQSFTDHSFGTQPFSGYQTDGVYTVVVTWKNGVIMKDTYRFRVEEAREKAGDQGWKDWWSTWVFVECPINLTPRTDPEGMKKIFMHKVCGSIPTAITYGPSVSSRAAFLSHFMQREDQGFHAQICSVNDNKPIYKFSEFETWISTVSQKYDFSNLNETRVESYENFSFNCLIDVAQNYGPNDIPWRRVEFKMKAYFEINRWLVKETRIGCEYKVDPNGL